MNPTISYFQFKFALFARSCDRRCGNQDVWGHRYDNRFCTVCTDVVLPCTKKHGSNREFFDAAAVSNNALSHLRSVPFMR